MPQGAPRAREIGAPSHPRATGFDALREKLVEEGAFIDERQHPDVESTLTQRRNQERPLPLGTGDIEPGTDKEDRSSASHGHAASVASHRGNGTKLSVLYTAERCRPTLDASCPRTRLSSSGPCRSG